MSPLRSALRTGARRGWTEFMLSVRSPQDQGFYLFMALVAVGYLYLNRNSDVPGTDLSYPAVVMPSMLGAIVAFGMVIGPGYALAMEREDGTLLRAKAAPYGLQGYVAGQVVLHSMSLIPTLVVILLPSFILFGDLMSNGAAGWATVLWVLALGMLATLPIGLVLGAVVPGVQKMGTWGMLPFIVIVAISGIFYPLQELWGWVQGVAQVFPVYWLGLGMRSAFLPDAAATLEISGTWRTTGTVLVLTLWAVVGLALVPRVLRRMARRQSGSAVAAAKDQATQWVR